ncbi:MAG: hypothetical protein U9M89_02720 [Patescibacteria group bacterium]|nr:hypothetical protein [Patescibacteria group bacterium]
MKQFNSPKKGTHVKVGNASVPTTSILLFVALLVSYIVVINVVSTKGAQIQSLEVSKKGLMAENERLEVEAARLQSLAVIEEGATEQIEIGNNLDEVDEISFVDEDLEEEIKFVPKMVQTEWLNYIEDTDVIASR